ncbi:hypothetical protein VEE18_47600 (plasmid) [Escherichia coli]|nr:hypothetical protein VEE18_47600 [Escherichia coli]
MFNYSSEKQVSVHFPEDRECVICDGDSMKIFAGREAIIEGDFYTLSDATHISTEYFYKPFSIFNPF